MYSTIRSKQVKGRTKPAPVRNTIVLFDGGRRTRVPGFGAGILAYQPATKLPCSVGDLDAVAQMFADTDSERAEERLAIEAEYDARVDQAAFEDACLERYTRGHLAL
jgi:hypothetical protein